MLRRVGRPGLIGLAARTAVVAGTANAVQNRMIDRREDQERAREAEAMQAQMAAQQQYQQQYAPPPPQPAPQPAAQPAASSDLIAELSKLSDLKSQGLLTDEEFAAAKAKLLA